MTQDAELQRKIVQVRGTLRLLQDWSNASSLVAAADSPEAAANALAEALGIDLDTAHSLLGTPLHHLMRRQLLAQQLEELEKVAQGRDLGDHR